MFFSTDSCTGVTPTISASIVGKGNLVPHYAVSMTSFYERVGGAATFRQLAREFYQGVESDPPLRAMYPEEDLGPAEDRLRLFLEQYWGGPKTYGETRGHPRLRIRHAPFVITPTQRDRWVHHMMAAVDTLGLEESDDAELRDYLVRAAQFMVNAMEGPTVSGDDAVGHREQADGRP